MKKSVKVISRAEPSERDKLYIPAIIDGLKITTKHLFNNLKDINQIDVLEYPEEQPTDITNRYRGLHRLTHREDNSIRCVACFMCATACPSNCIYIEATERNDAIDEKMPKIFNIDLLECVYCGYCVEACPCDAIRMDTGIFSFIAKTKEEFILTKDKLLSHTRCKDFDDE